MSRPAKLSERLARTLCLVVGGLWLTCALGVTWYVRQEITESFDSALVESARRLLDLAVHEIEEMDYQTPLAHSRQQGGEVRAAGARAIPESQSVKVENDYLVYQVMEASGRMLLRSANAPMQALPASAGGGFAQQAEWRSFALQHPTRPVWIVVADSMEHRQEAVTHTVLWLSLPVLALLPVLLWLTRRIIEIELRPLERLSDELAARGGRNLTALNVLGLPQELQPVLASVNHLLLRLDEALKTERALAANAAHELRTPLASARLLLLTAAAHEDLPSQARHTLQQTLDSLDVLSRRAEKLLQLSRAESSAAWVQEPVDLGKVISAVVDEFRSVSGRLVWQPEANPGVWVFADVDSLAIAIRNLIENSVRHAPESNVHVQVMADGAHARVVVRDEGPGVPAPDLERIRSRHARLGAGGSGYGLGLSIVSGIMSRQGGHLDLQSPAEGSLQGFQAVLQLRLAPMPA